MAFEHVLLTEVETGPAVWKMVEPDAPAQLQGMVARGLAPLPPRDLVVALYQLWVENQPELADQAAKTVEGLPPSILDGALNDSALHPGVLDFLSRKLRSNVRALEGIVRHARVHDDTLVGVSRIGPEIICDILAQNQARWLRCPAIVEALYQNPHCRMSVAQRMLELAVREGLELKLPNMEEIKQALASKAGDMEVHDDEDDDEEDRQFRELSKWVIEGQEEAVKELVEAAPEEELDLAMPDEPKEDLAELDKELDRAQREAAAPSAPLASESNEPEKKPRGDRITRITQLPTMKKIRLAMMGSAFERRILIRDSNKSVCMSAIKSPRIKENEVVAHCTNRSLGHDIVRYICKRREWTKLYAVKLNLVLNPKTPMSSAITFLTHLHAHDVRKVARSKNIPTALAMAAKRRMHERR